MRLATLMTTSGPRLHVRAHGGGYVDIGEATGEARFAAFESFVAAGPARDGSGPRLQDRDGREYPLSDFGPAVPAPARILCLGLNYSEHTLEGGGPCRPGRTRSCEVSRRSWVPTPTSSGLLPPRSTTKAS